MRATQPSTNTWLRRDTRNRQTQGMDAHTCRIHTRERQCAIVRGSDTWQGVSHLAVPDASPCASRGGCVDVDTRLRVADAHEGPRCVLWDCACGRPHRAPLTPPQYLRLPLRSTLWQPQSRQAHSLETLLTTRSWRTAQGRRWPCSRARLQAVAQWRSTPCPRTTRSAVSTPAIQRAVAGASQA